MKVKDHYDTHLGNFYSWMIGNFVEKQQDQQLFFTHHNIKPFSSKVAIDLGAGHGLQSVSLANAGFHVKAVDFNVQLLHELKLNTTNKSVEVIEADILSFLQNTNEQADCIVCMGDTLTHFETTEQLETCVALASKLLVSKGRFILSFRDLSTPLLRENRFIPVRSDDNRILTCFLEDFPNRVMVHDLLHEKADGVWTLKTSSYPKLKISEAYVTKLLVQNNLRVVHSEIKNRMIHLIAEKN